MLYLYTETFHTGPKLKRILKKILGREIRGPQAVERSLIDGLNQNRLAFIVNAPLSSDVKTAGVLSDAQTLRWVISQKEKGRIKKIIAGPNIAISPNDENGLWRHPLIDVVIVPSHWVKDHYIHEAPELKEKIRVWPAGVDLPKDTGAEKIYDFLVYNKIGGNILHSQIVSYLQKKDFKVAVLKYGSFKQENYFKLLEQSKFEIYLSESESQGLSMFEAWARGVPTFVWERGFWQAKNFRWQGLTASPFLVAEAGMRFKDFEDFTKNLEVFIKGEYTPQKYIKDNFTNSIAAQKYLQIYNSFPTK